MAEQHVNFMGGSPLNRLSWLRSSHEFLNAIVGLPSARWILFNNGSPLADAHRSRVAYLSTKDVKPLLGPEPYFGQGQHDGKLLLPDQKNSHTEAARHRNAPIVFLGLHENTAGHGALPSSDFADAEAAVKHIDGVPYFSLDVAHLDKTSDELDAFVKTTDLAKDAEAKLNFVEPRGFIMASDAFTAAVLALGRSMVDWNYRNKFCAGCGSPSYSLWGGWKLSCSSTLPWASPREKPCPTVKGLNNFMHPRTDPVVIMIAIDETGERILLGRGKKYPGAFYSALAGFMEPGETFEDSVIREMWEEAGVKVWDVKYHSGQPWPFPANLMVGFYARADASQPIRVDLDNELEDARWYTREEVRAVLDHPLGATLTNRDQKALTAIAAGDEAPKEEVKKDLPPFRLPPTTAIAGVLIRDWVEGRISYPAKL